MSTQQPNIIYMHSHDTGRRISPYGYAVHTPHLQTLADQGVLFRNAFCAAPTCSPSRAALLTGQWAHCTGMLGLQHRGFQLTHPERHLATVLRGHGYQTTLVGFNHVHADPAAIGYDSVLPRGRSHTAELAATAGDFLRSRPKSPFFLDVGFVDTHNVMLPSIDQVHQDDDPDRVRPVENLPDTPQTRQDAARFATAVRRLDEGVGTVLAALNESGLADNTIVICTTDHGIGLPWHKCNCTDGGLGVMLLMRGPHAALRPGTTCESLVSQIDLFPTLCDMLNLPRPDWLQGQSLLPVLSGEVAEVNDAIFGEVSYHAAYEPQRAVRTQRWKYIRRYGDRASPVPANIDDGPSKRLVMAAGLLDRPHDRESLFDLLLDPHERRNLAKDPQLADVRDDMASRLDRWMQETADPILNGPIILPAEAVVNQPDALSSSDPPVHQQPA